MKKKTVKKLALAKETVRQLEDVTLNNVAGGASQYCNTAVHTYQNSCQVDCVDEPIRP